MSAAEETKKEEGRFARVVKSKAFKISLGIGVIALLFCKFFKNDIRRATARLLSGQQPKPINSADGCQKLGQAYANFIMQNGNADAIVTTYREIGEKGSDGTHTLEQTLSEVGDGQGVIRNINRQVNGGSKIVEFCATVWDGPLKIDQFTLNELAQ